jgi:WD40 repeat protein
MIFLSSATLVYTAEDKNDFIGALTADTERSAFFSELNKNPTTNSVMENVIESKNHPLIAPHLDLFDLFEYDYDYASTHTLDTTNDFFLTKFKKASDQDKQTCVKKIWHFVESVYKEGLITPNQKKCIPVILIFANEQEGWYPLSIVEKSQTLKPIIDNSGLIIDKLPDYITNEILGSTFSYIEKLETSPHSNLNTITQEYIKDLTVQQCLSSLIHINYLDISTQNLNTNSIIATLLENTLSKPISIDTVKNDTWKQLNSITSNFNIMLASTNESNESLDFVRSDNYKIDGFYFDAHSKMLFYIRPLKNFKGVIFTYRDGEKQKDPVVAPYLKDDFKNFIVNKKDQIYGGWSDSKYKLIKAKLRLFGQNIEPIILTAGCKVTSMAFDQEDKGLCALSIIQKETVPAHSITSVIHVFSPKNIGLKKQYTIKEKDECTQSTIFIPGSTSLLCCTTDSDNLTTINAYRVKIVDYTNEKAYKKAYYRIDLNCSNNAKNLRKIIALQANQKKEGCAVGAFASNKDIYITPINTHNHTFPFSDSQSTSSPDKPYSIKDAHAEPITSLMFHPTEPLLASCSQKDMTIKIWNTQYFHCVGTFTNPAALPEILGFFTPGDEKASLYTLYVTSQNKLYKRTIVGSKGLSMRQSLFFECYMQAIENKHDLTEPLRLFFNTLPTPLQDYLRNITTRTFLTPNNLQKTSRLGWVPWTQRTAYWMGQGINSVLYHPLTLTALSILAALRARKLIFDNDQYETPRYWFNGALPKAFPSLFKE